MKARPQLLLSTLATLWLGSTLAAQTPRNPPPWWGEQHEVGISLYWDFSGATIQQALTPQQIATASWYNPSVTVGAVTGPLQQIPTLTTHTDVLGLVGNGTPQQASLDLTIDNDPHLNWVKIFWFQFDAFEGASGDIGEQIAQNLSHYERSSVTWESESIGGGWETVTISAELWPQPDDEEIDFSFFENAVGNAAIDNLFVNSKCVKVEEADEDGDAMGAVDSSTFPTTGFDLFAATGRDCLAAAVTESQAFVRTYWISATAPGPGTQHQLIQFNAQAIPIATTNLPDTLATAPAGASDLAVETILLSPTGHQQFVYALVDLRGTPANVIVLRAINATTGALSPARNVQIPGGPIGPGPLGLAFNGSSNFGAGTFVITDQNGTAFEIDRQTGGVLRQFNCPPQTTGAGYDATFGKYYFFSSQPEVTPAGPLQVNGYEWSGYDLQPTGTRFWGNLQVPNVGSPGGIASGLEVYRRLGGPRQGEFQMMCIAKATTGSFLYELDGPFQYGQSIHGVTGMRGQPFGGSTNFELTLEGLEPGTASFAALYAGFSNTNSVFGTLPLSLSGIGLPESQLLVSTQMHSVLFAPQANGVFRFQMPQLPMAFRNAPLFFQWLVFDPNVPNGLALPSAGKTLIY